jgi:hypothetical protein
MADESKTLQLAGSTRHYACHVCAFFHSRDEEAQILKPFIREGFDVGDKIFQILAPEDLEERRHQIAELGIDLDSVERSRQLEVRPWEEAHLRPGHFDQHAMLALLDDAMEGMKSEGFRRIRIWANMEWALKDLPGTHDLVEYESRFNTILPKHDGAVVCTYDLTRFGAATVMDVLRTHPFAVMGGALYENPFYVPTEDPPRAARPQRGAPVSGRPLRLSERETILRESIWVNAGRGRAALESPGWMRSSPSAARR